LDVALQDNLEEVRMAKLVSSFEIDIEIIYFCFQDSYTKYDYSMLSR
jgi:hypothetical protein